MITIRRAIAAIRAAVKRAFSTLNETHAPICYCSYCRGDYRLHYGLNIPEDWRAWNAWWVIKYGHRRYYRFHWPEWFYSTRPPKVGYRGNRTVSEAGRSAQSASAEQETLDSDHARYLASGVSLTEQSFKTKAAKGFARSDGSRGGKIAERDQC